MKKMLRSDLDSHLCGINIEITMCKRSGSFLSWKTSMERSFAAEKQDKSTGSIDSNVQRSTIPVTIDYIHISIRTLLVFYDMQLFFVDSVQIMYKRKRDCKEK